MCASGNSRILTKWDNECSDIHGPVWEFSVGGERQCSLFACLRIGHVGASEVGCKRGSRQVGDLCGLIRIFLACVHAAHASCCSPRPQLLMTRLSIVIGWHDLLDQASLDSSTYKNPHQLRFRGTPSYIYSPLGGGERSWVAYLICSWSVDFQFWPVPAVHQH